MRPSNEEIIRALRCASTVVNTVDADQPEPCEDCHYYIVKRDARGREHSYCDIDRVDLDAADRLEELTRWGGGGDG